jgi:hypothetical protein
VRQTEDQPWVALNREELARENSGSEIAQELAEAREKTEVAVARAALLIRQRAGTEAELARVTAELERLRAIVQQHFDGDASDLRPTESDS